MDNTHLVDFERTQRGYNDDLARLTRVSKQDKHKSLCLARAGATYQPCIQTEERRLGAISLIPPRRHISTPLKLRMHPCPGYLLLDLVLAVFVTSCSISSYLERLIGEDMLLGLWTS